VEEEALHGGSSGDPYRGQWLKKESISKRYQNTDEYLNIERYIVILVCCLHLYGHFKTSNAAICFWTFPELIVSVHFFPCRFSIHIWTAVDCGLSFFQPWDKGEAANTENIKYWLINAANIEVILLMLVEWDVWNKRNNRDFQKSLPWCLAAAKHLGIGSWEFCEASLAYLVL
jgi:hypothetical protein